MKIIANAFSLQMLSSDGVVKIETLDLDTFKSESDGADSCIGHPDTARVVSDCLGRDVPCNRTNVSLNTGDELYVAQLSGGRLPEGAKTLPDGFTFKWIKVTIQ